MKSLRIDVVVDIGANEGQFGLELRRAGYTGRIVSIEPLADPFNRLSRLATKDRDWIAIQTALGPQAGSATMHVASNGGASSSILQMLDTHARAAPEARFVADEQVDMETLDAIASQYLPDESRLFMKVDVQGYELQVLAGGAVTLSRSSLVQLEMSLIPLYGSAPSFQDVLDFMRRQRYQLVGIEPGLAAPSGLLLQVDGLFALERTTRTLETLGR
jgi:FkbM family methyltransferase